MSTTTIAEIRAKVTGGGDINNVLGAMRTGTLNAKEATLLLKEAIASAGKAQTETAKIAKSAAKDAITDIRLRTDAERQAAREETAARRGAAQEAKQAAREATQAKREELRAIKEAEKAQRDASRTAREYGQTMREVAQHASAAFGHVSKLAGVKGFGEHKQDVDDVEKLMVDARASLGWDRDKFAASGARKTFFDVASASGQPVEEVIKGFIKAQNETSGGERLLANGGSLLKSQSSFAGITGGTIADTTITLAKFAEQYGINEKDQGKIPAALYQQQLQGSLEADTADKFIKIGALHKQVTGAKGFGGMMGMLALGNTIKDQGGFKGKQGAATTATYLQALLGDLAKGKSTLDGEDKSPTAMLQHFLGKDFHKKDGTLDPTEIADELVDFRKKVGGRNFGNMMSLTFKNLRSRQAMMLLMASREQYKAGHPKSVEALASPDVAKGQGQLADIGDELKGTANVQNTILGNEEKRTGLGNQNDTKGFFLRFRKWWGQVKAEHPVASAVYENPGLQGAAGMATAYAGGKVAQKVAPGLLARIMPWLGGAGLRTAGGVAGLLTMSGNTGEMDDIMSDPKRKAEYERRTAEGTAGALQSWRAIKSKRAAQGGSKWGDGTGFSSDAEVDKIIKQLEDTLSKLQQPQINIYINAPGVEARTTPEAKTTRQLANGTNAAPAATPGRRG